MAEVRGEVTRLLGRLELGDREAVAELLPLVYEDLRAIAAGRLAGERRNHTLQPTALVHEAWIRLFSKSSPGWADRRHFYRAAATVMRYILVDAARQNRRLKRGGGAQPLPLDEQLIAVEERAIDLVALDEALERLAEMDARRSSVVELRFFGGLSVEETADVLGVSARTVEADWSLARAWLLSQIEHE